MLDPDQAVSILRPELEDIINRGEIEQFTKDDIDRTESEVIDLLTDELRRNFQLLQSLPSDPPTQGDIQSFYRKGVITTSRFEQLLKRFGRGNGRTQQYILEQTIDKGPEQIRRQAALDRLSDSEALSQLTRLGFSESEANAILNGSDPSALIEDRIADRETENAFPVSLAVNVGDARSQQLQIAGITSLQDLANATGEEIQTITDMNFAQSEEAIDSAALLLREATGQ